MKLTCDRETMQAAFHAAAAFAPQRSPQAVLQRIKLAASERSVHLLATDTEVSIRLEVPEAAVEVPGEALLPRDRFAAILRESSDAVLHIQADERGITVTGVASEFRLPTEDPREFPDVEPFDSPGHCELPARLLRELIHRTVFVTDQESSRYAMGGVLLEWGQNQVTAVATDGRRLACMEGPAVFVGEGPSSAGNSIVPARAVQLIERTLSDSDAEVRLAVRGNDLLVRSPRCTIRARLLEGRFPRWRDVLKQAGGSTQVELPAGTFSSAVRQAAIVTDAEHRAIQFAFEQGKLLLSCSAPGAGEARIEVPVSYDGPPQTIRLDPRFLIEFLRVIEPEQSVTLSIKDENSAARCETADGYVYIVMPLAR
jgi:DNA polymerase-3 subunit beta